MTAPLPAPLFAEDYVYESQHGHVHAAPAFVGRAAVPKTIGWKQVFIENPDDTDTDTDDNAAGDGAANTSGLGTHASPFVFEGKNKKPEHPSMTWLMKQLEKRDVGTGATRTSTYAEVTKEPSDANKYPLMKDQRGKVTLTNFGEMSYRLLPGTRIGDLGATEHIYQEMQAVADGTRTVEEVIAVVASWVIEDIAQMKTNAALMRDALGLTTAEPKEHAEGHWVPAGNRPVRFSRVWSGHRFTDQECAALLAGQEITITAVSEKKVQARAADPTFTVRGTLAEKTFDGRKMIGFDPVFGNTDTAGNPTPPDSWCGHVFTQAEKKVLSTGGEVTATDFISQKRTRFTAAVHFGQDGDRWKIIPTFTPRPKTQNKPRRSQPTKRHK
ncbi:hypothetical protein [Subtercola vilae]|uniref:hypothetical protein n=1 Tax=Subtercola vilae TaxID=2056433 RepID=UPI001375E5C3|nr:hypothetical protein [Subtercola vilae]